MSNYQRGTRPSATEPQTKIAQDDGRRQKPEWKGDTGPRSRTEARTQQLLRRGRRALLLTPEASSEDYTQLALVKSPKMLKLASTMYLAKEGHRIKELRKKTVERRKGTIAEDVPYIPRSRRAAFRAHFQKDTIRPFPRVQLRVSHDKLSAILKLYETTGKQKYLMPHARVVALMCRQPERQRARECRKVLEKRGEVREALQILDDIEAREHEEDRKLGLMATGQMEPEVDGKEYTLNPGPWASMFTATPRDGMDWAAVGTSDKSKVLSDGWESASMPKRKSPLSNVMLA